MNEEHKHDWQLSIRLLHKDGDRYLCRAGMYATNPLFLYACSCGEAKKSDGLMPVITGIRGRPYNNKADIWLSRLLRR